MKNYLLIILLSFCALSLMFPKTNPKIAVKGSSFSLNITFDAQPYKDSTVNQFVIRNYYEATNPSKPGSFKLPSEYLNLAIPPYSNPTIKFTVVKETNYRKTIPSVNPMLTMLNDSTLSEIQTDIKEVKQSSNTPAVEIVGYFWFREFYCVSIKINTHLFDHIKSVMTEIQNLHVEVQLPSTSVIRSKSTIKSLSPFDAELKDVIANWEIAEQFRSTSTKDLIKTKDGWINFKNDYLKIGIADDGLFRIDKRILDSLGFDTKAIDPTTFQLYESGKEIPIFVRSTGSSFGDSDYIEFYGQIGRAHV